MLILRSLFNLGPRGTDPTFKMPSPIKESIPSFPPPMTTQLHAPPSPGTHRALRRLQSAHSLGAKANQPSLISQQRLQQQQQQFQQQQHPQLPPPQLQQQQQAQQQYQQQYGQRQGSSSSPSRRNGNSNRSPQRARANSDAAMVNPLNAMAANRRSALSKRSLAADAMSLERLLRDGPPNGDVCGALESARLKILDQGIKSDGDGMVSLDLVMGTRGALGGSIISGCLRF